MKVSGEESIYGQLGDPLAYPSTLRTGAFYVDHDQVYQLDWKWSDVPEVTELASGGPLRDISARAAGAVESLCERVPQIAFGANRDIANLAWKFENYAERSGHEAEPFFVLSGSVADADVVMCNIGYWGYIYAALLTSRGGGRVARAATLGNDAPVAVLLLTPRQMAMMHTSEGVPKSGETERQGVSCDVALLEAEVFGKRLMCQQYALPLPFLSFDRKTPMGFAAVPHRDTSVRRWSQREAWAALIDHPKINEFLQPAERGIPELIALLRLGAPSRKGGGVGSKDRSQEVYDFVRRAIIEELHLQDDDGSALLPTTGLNVLSPERAWSPAPTIGSQLP